MGDYLKDYHFGYQINYLCYKWRINFGASVFRWRTYVKGYDNDDNYITKYFVQDEGVSLITRYPLDRYYRVDLSFSAYNRIEEHFDGIAVVLTV